MAKTKLTKRDTSIDAAFEHLNKLSKPDYRPEGEGWFSPEEHAERVDQLGGKRSSGTHRKHLRDLHEMGKLEKIGGGSGTRSWYRPKQD